VRPATGAADRIEAPAAKRVRDSDDVTDAVGHRAPAVASRATTPWAGLDDVAHTPLGADLDKWFEHLGRAGRAVMREHRNTVVRPGENHL